MLRETTVHAFNEKGADGRMFDSEARDEQSKSEDYFLPLGTNTQDTKC